MVILFIVCVCVCVYITAHAYTHTHTHKVGQRNSEDEKKVALRKNSVKCSQTLDHLTHDGVGFTVIVLCFVAFTHVQLVEMGRKQDGSLLS